jgi:predicted DNA-binding protein with PD1-like motif
MAEILGPYTASAYFVRVGEGEKLPEALVEAVERIGARFALVTGIGGFSQAKVAVYDASTSTYHYIEAKPLRGHVLEVASLQGNVACFSGKCHPHLHVVLARTPADTVAGHLLEARVKPFLELFIVAVPAGEESLARLFQHRKQLPKAESLYEG